jgi:hypothetical protein
MEEFLAREKAALEALELQGDAMEVDPPVEPKASLVSSGVCSPVGSQTLSAVSQAHSIVYSNAHSANSVKTPISTPRSPTMVSAMEETAAMQAARTERLTRIAERDAAASQVSLGRRTRAKSDLEVFKTQWKTEVGNRREANRTKAETVGSPWDKEEPVGRVAKEQLDWGRVTGLLETLPKPSKDSSRLLSIINSLVESGDKK